MRSLWLLVTLGWGWLLAVLRAGKFNSREKGTLQKSEDSWTGGAHQSFDSWADLCDLQMNQRDYPIIPRIGVHHRAALSNSIPILAQTESQRFTQKEALA